MISPPNPIKIIDCGWLSYLNNESILTDISLRHTIQNL